MESYSGQADPCLVVGLPASGDMGHDIRVGTATHHARYVPSNPAEFDMGLSISLLMCVPTLSFLSKKRSFRRRQAIMNQGSVYAPFVASNRHSDLFFFCQD